MSEEEIWMEEWQEIAGTFLDILRKLYFQACRKRSDEGQEEENLTSGLIDEVFQKLVGIKVTCEDCKKRINLNYCYHCYDCNFWFCKDCAGIHFKKGQEEIEKLKDIIAKSAPLAWMHTNDYLAAHQWEQEAFEAIGGKVK